MVSSHVSWFSGGGARFQCLLTIAHAHAPWHALVLQSKSSPDASPSVLFSDTAGRYAQVPASWFGVSAFSERLVLRFWRGADRHPPRAPGLSRGQSRTADDETQGRCVEDQTLRVVEPLGSVRSAENRDSACCEIPYGQDAAYASWGI